MYYISSLWESIFLSIYFCTKEEIITIFYYRLLYVSSLMFLFLQFLVYFITYFAYLFYIEGKPIPTELRRDAEALKKEIDLEDNYTAKPRVSIILI